MIVWDFPIRLFHWLLVLALAGAWWAAENDAMEWHRRAGYTIGALVMFRVIWGFLDPGAGRFSAFLVGPGAVLEYVRKDIADRHAPARDSHNPLGGWSVLAMLAALVLQVSLGMIAIDVDGLEAGPFSYLVSFETARAAAEWHESVFDLLLMLAGLHVAAVLFYALSKRQDLLVRMIVGRRLDNGAAQGSRLAAFAVAVLAGGLVWAAVAFWGRA